MPSGKARWIRQAESPHDDLESRMERVGDDSRLTDHPSAEHTPCGSTIATLVGRIARHLQREENHADEHDPAEVGEELRSQVQGLKPEAHNAEDRENDRSRRQSGW